MNTGTFSVSGGSMSKNTAAENGGAVYAANAAVGISDGTIGGENEGNSAASGGAAQGSGADVRTGAWQWRSWGALSRRTGWCGVNVCCCAVFEEYCFVAGVLSR